jgi:hypothetical protein
METILTEGRTFLQASPPCEGSPAVFRGKSASWSLSRGPEPFLTWGGYYTQNHLAVVSAAAAVTPEQPGPRRWRLQTRIASQVLVAVNGRVVFETPLRPATIMEGQENAEYEFEAALEPGPNQLGLILLRMGRMARVGFRLELLPHAGGTGGVRVEAAPPDGMPVEQRSRLEEQVAGLKLERDTFYPEHTLRLGVPETLDPAFGLAVRLSGSRLEPIRAVRRDPGLPGGWLEICPAGGLEDGSYRLECDWQDAQGQTLTTTSFQIQKTTHTAPLPGFEHLAERKRLALELYAEGWDARPIWNQLACYALGRFEKIDESVLRAACEFIMARNDTADFVMQAILRLLYWEKRQPRLSPGLRALMKETVLGFKYWVDEPGDTVM